MEPNTFYHTKFPVLTDVLIETMQENIKSNSGWALIKSTIDLRALERNRSMTMLAIVYVLKKGLDKGGPIQNEHKALLLLGVAAVKHMGVSVNKRILPKMIELSSYKGNLRVFFVIDKTLGNKVFQDQSPNYPMCNEIGFLVNNFYERETAVLHILKTDLKQCKLLQEPKLNVKILDDLLDNSRYAKELKAPLTLECIRRFRKGSFIGRMDKGPYEIVRKMVITSLKADLFKKIFQLIP